MQIWKQLIHDMHGNGSRQKITETERRKGGDMHPYRKADGDKHPYRKE